MPTCIFCDHYDLIGYQNARCKTCDNGQWLGFKEAEKIKIYPDGVDYCVIYVDGKYRMLTKFGELGLPYLDPKYQKIWNRDHRWTSLGYPSGTKLKEDADCMPSICSKCELEFIDEDEISTIAEHGSCNSCFAKSLGGIN